VHLALFRQFTYFTSCISCIDDGDGVFVL